MSISPLTGLTRIALLLLVLLCGVLPAGACDICARMPDVPILFDHPAAIELGQAAWLASERRLIDLNPTINLPQGATPATRRMRLDDLTGRQLMHAWFHSTAGRLPRDLRFTLAVLFVDTGEVCELDLRMGHAIPREPDAGPVDYQLATTKAGWYALPRLGLRQCESLQLIAIDPDSTGNSHRELSRLFPERTVAAGSTKSSAPRLPSAAGNRATATATTLRTAPTTTSSADQQVREKHRRVLLRVGGWMVTHRRAHGRR